MPTFGGNTFLEIAYNVHIELFTNHLVRDLGPQNPWKLTRINIHRNIYVFHIGSLKTEVFICHRANERFKMLGLGLDVQLMLVNPSCLTRSCKTELLGAEHSLLYWDIDIYCSERKSVKLWHVIHWLVISWLVLVRAVSKT